MLFDQALQLFTQHHELAEHSPRTIEFYSTWLQRFDHSLMLHELDAITVIEMRAWLLSLKYAGLSPSSRRGAAITLKTFFRWCHSEQLITHNPSDRLELPKKQKKKPDVLTTSDLLTLINEIQRTSHNRKRDTALVCFLAESGVRRAEVIGLEPAKLHIIEGYAVVTGKGRKQRWVFFGEATQISLAEWLTDRPTSLATVFGLTESGLREVLRRLSHKTGLHIHPHKFRRSAATLRASKGMTAPSLQATFGWERIETANAYIIDAETIAQAKTSHPLDNQPWRKAITQ